MASGMLEYYCPHCNSILFHETPCFTMFLQLDKEMWTDSLLRPQYGSGTIVACPKCKKHLWTDKAESHKREKGVYGYLPNASRSLWANGTAGYLEVLDSKQVDSEESECSLRLEFWHEMNEAMQDGKDVPDGAVFDGNLLRLLSLVQGKDEKEVLQKAEILRELGRFRQAMELVDHYKPFVKDRNDEIAGAIYGLALNKERSVRAVYVIQAE